MIAKLFGLIDSVHKNWLIINVNGVGYKVFCSRKTLDQVPNLSEACTLFTETIVREDFIHIYGFANAHEQEWFNILISVQGVGMKAALAILSVAGPDDLYHAIQNQDKAIITMADGIGPKLGARIINELKDKIGHIALSHPISISRTIQAGSTSARQDATSALLNLGYKLPEIHQVLTLGLEDNKETTQKLIKSTLR